MKKLFVVLVFMVLSLFISQADVNAKGKPVVESTLWSEETIDFGVDLEVCVSGYHSFTYNIYAGQDIFAGTLNMYINDEGNFVFSVDQIDGALAQELHIYMYDSIEALPVKRPAPGLAPYKLGEIFENEFEYVIEMDELVDGSKFYFVFHLALVDENIDVPSGVGGETAYIGEPNGPEKGAWFYAFGFEVIECEDGEEEIPTIYVAFHAVYGDDTVWAVGETTFIDLGLTSSRWGWQLTFDQNPETFELYAGAAQNDLSKGTFVGTLTLSWDGEYVTFTLDLEDGVQFTEIQIHVDYLPVDTISPGQLGYTAPNPPFDGTWTVSLLPESDR